jgi:SpoVK/Ycf46/Vps4 family AAA+-type ATPase
VDRPRRHELRILGDAAVTAFEETVRTLVRARHSVIWIVTAEESRALRIAEAVALKPKGPEPDVAPPARAASKAIYCWARSTGFARIESGKAASPIPKTEDPAAALDFLVNDNADDGAIYVMRDMHRFLNEQSNVYRILRDAANALLTTRKTIIVTSPVSRIPIELEKCVVVVDMPLPNAQELGVVLDAALVSWESDSRISQPVNGEREAVIRAGLGLTEEEFSSAVIESVVQVRKVDPRLVVKAKTQIVRKAGIEFADSSEGMSEVGGLENLKRWIKRKGLAFSEKAAQFPLSPPRGLFLTGPPGTGKSLTARAAANFLGFPILKVSADAIFSKYVGDSEGNLARILKTAEAVAPSVLYVDEVEKLAAGMRGSGDNDSGVSRRVLGQLLSWMQDHTSPVLLVATANDPLGIPPELMGRFDATFFVDMPDANERREILDIHLRKKRHTLVNEADGVSVTRAVDVMDGFSGREIERTVNEALFVAYEDGARDLRASDLTLIAKGTRPLSVSRKSEIDSMRTWAKDNAIPASDRVAKAASPVAAAEV